jgi:hypothetical protein
MRRIIEILALISIAVILISTATLPWPANIIITGMLVAAIAVDSLHAWRAKNHEHDTSCPESDPDTPTD